jgi:hypothetical protein
MRWELLEECYHHEALRKSTLGHARARIWRRVVTRWSNLRKGRAKVGAKNALFRVFRFACYPTHPHLCARMGNSIARLVSPLKVYVVFWFFFCFFQLASPFPQPQNWSFFGDEHEKGVRNPDKFIYSLIIWSLFTKYLKVEFYSILFEALYLVFFFFWIPS